MFKITPSEVEAIRHIIETHCANCDEDGNCILLDDACVQLNSSKYIYCNHFLRAVLPLDKSLYAELCSDNKKRCEVCEKYFIPRNNRQKYCDNCSPSKRNDYMKNYMRKKRDKC